MNSEDKMFSVVWAAITIVVCTFIISVTTCTMNQNKLVTLAVTDAIAKGVDPLKAGCALSDETKQAICAIAAQKN